MSDTKLDIQSRLHELRRQDSAMRTEALRAISTQTRPMFAALWAECAETGHRWKFDHWNFTRSCQWDKCVWCDAAEPADRHGGEPTDV